MPKVVQIPKADREEHAYAKAHVREVLAIRERFATAIIASGIFNTTDELWTEVVGRTAEAEALPIHKALEPLERMRVANPFKKGETTSAGDVFGDLMSVYGDAGFLVGLAVGMQLGPHAFDGGAR